MTTVLIFQTPLLDFSECPELTGEWDQIQHNRAVRLLRVKSEFGCFLLKSHLENQVLELHTVIDAQKEEHLPDLDSEEKFCEIIEELRQHLVNVRASFQNRTLSLHRLQLGNARLAQMKENDAYMEMMKCMLKHCRDLTKAQQEVMKLREKQYEINKKRNILNQLCQEKMKEISTMQKQREEELKDLESDKLKKARLALEEELKTVALLQNVIQGIIVGGRVNWALDPELRSLVLKLESNPAFD
ncbi:centromere protein H isoform X1 [Protopterus annectens]|uniref:centromere protein H isoform X1 n=1 Tax=Protopterus annectens TaxID=7888 RepID=UPI001CFC0421|nr:centromere protein H isoform X1 [Protopterus annectens]